MVQKKAFAVILGTGYMSYESALLTLKQDRLDTRRQNLSLKFALKCTLSNQHKTMFPLQPCLQTQHEAPQALPGVHLSHGQVLQQP